MDEIKLKRNVWGEIQRDSPVNASKLWRRFDEYTNTEHQRNIKRETSPSDTRSLATEDDRDLNYDPVGSRLIELRKYHVYLNQQRRLQARYKSEGRQLKVDYHMPPPFPDNYPFSETLEETSFHTRKMIKCSSGMSKNVLENKRKNCVKRVIAQVGFIDQEDEVVNYLSAILDDFLQKFVKVLSRKKHSEHFSEDKDLWNVFETTLRCFGIGGVSALHSFYFENIVKKHDLLERKCNDIYDRLQESLKAEEIVHR